MQRDYHALVRVLHTGHLQTAGGGGDRVNQGYLYLVSDVLVERGECEHQRTVSHLWLHTRNIGMYDNKPTTHREFLVVIGPVVVSVISYEESHGPNVRLLVHVFDCEVDRDGLIRGPGVV